MAGRDDETLQEKLREALQGDINLRSYGLTADVVEGEAQIQGIVDSLAEKEHAGRLAKSIPGIRGVANAVAISTDGDIRDADVSFEVAEELGADPGVDTRHIGAKASGGGTVTLVGNTADPGEIEAARRAASKARGVTKVVSQVKIRQPELSLEEIFHSQVRNDEED